MNKQQTTITNKQHKEIKMSKVKQKELPFYPSELLKLALDDISVINKDKRYKIDVKDWYRRNENTCSVSLAGAVLVNTLKFDGDYSIKDGSHVFNPKIDSENVRKLSIINSLRRLYVFSVYDNIKLFLGQNMTEEESEMLEDTMENVEKKLKKINKTLKWVDFYNFKDFQISHDFYSSMVKDLEYLDEKILGRI